MSPSDLPAVTGPALDRMDGARDGLAVLRETVVSAREETDAGDEAMWSLADMLETLDPALTGWNLDLADAALLLFGEIGLGPTDRAQAWLRYAQKATMGLLGPADPRISAANTALGRQYYSLGEFGDAAAALTVVVDAHERLGRWHEADEVRIDWAVCLYGLGHCTEAVTLVQQAWARWKQDRRTELTGAHISAVCMEMLRLCFRRAEARAMWPDIADRLAPTFRYGGSWTESLTARYRRPLSAVEHGKVCAYRPRSVPEPAPGEAKEAVRPSGPGSGEERTLTAP